MRQERSFINQEAMKKANAADVLRLIRREGAVTRKQIESESGMCWGAVSKITARLLELGYLVEQKCETVAHASPPPSPAEPSVKSQKNVSPGRTPYLLLPSADRFFVLGVDINQVGIRVLAMNLRGEVAREVSGPADYSSRDALLRSLFVLLDPLVAAYVSMGVLSIGVAMQGVVDARCGVSLSLPQCPGWENVPLREILRERYSLSVLVEHDPVCLLYFAVKTTPPPSGESANALLLRLDQGVGMAVMLEGEMRNPPGAFEIGHTIAVPGGVACRCGRHGCLESYVSSRGLEAISGLPYPVLAQNARNGDPQASRIFETMADCLAAALLDSAALFKPETIYLCGALLQEEELFLPRILRRIGQEGASCAANALRPLHCESAALGAAMLAADLAELEI